MHLEIIGEGTEIVSDVVEEIEKSMKKYQLFNSAHEGYGVILEELDELWDEVKKRKPDRKNMRVEAVQVAAMAMKFIMSMENNWEPSAPKKERVAVDERGFTEKQLQNDAKCKQCLYAVLSDEDISKLGKDPCDTCHNISNWEPMEGKS